MKILIIGSSLHIMGRENKKQFNNSCIALGREIANRGHEIIVCSMNQNTADYYVILGYSEIKPKHEILFYRPSKEIRA
jgi:hypothetical protein